MLSRIYKLFKITAVTIFLLLFFLLPGIFLDITCTQVKDSFFVSISGWKPKIQMLFFIMGIIMIIIFLIYIVKKRIKRKLNHFRYYDSLTGLYNRVFLEENLEQFDNQEQLPLAIIMGDVNDLKSINQTSGYYRGDQLLVGISRILKKCCGEKSIIVRWAGDEFVILLPNTNLKAAQQVIKEIKNECEEKKGDRNLEPTIALGMIIRNNLETDIKVDLKKVEKWMYKHKLVENKSARSSIISSLGEVLWEKDYETKEHAERLKSMALKLGQALNLPGNKLDELILLAGLHDIGKIAIPNSILLKKGSFTSEEWETMKKHSKVGYKIAKASSELAPIAEGILYHHEWWDGNGYPQQLKGEQIPLISRIIAIVDAYDVMTHERPYKEALSKEEAIKELNKFAGEQFDPNLVKVFIKILQS